MTKPIFHQFICGEDNFCVLIHDPDSGMTAAVDTPDAEPIARELRAKGWTLTHILTTHHHYDHTDGHEELKAETGATLIGAGNDSARIPGLDMPVADGERFTLGRHTVEVLETPGHTRGAVCYWLPDAGVVFTGDTLFSLGCGRLFEGDGQMMWNSLQKLMALPPETQIYCGHEYTEANGRFALAVEPGNAALQQRVAEAKVLRSDGKATVPTTLAAEMAQNPFLRPSSSEIQAALGLSGQPLATIFTELRRRKDHF
ncbi:MAG: hydroxyacylglutathione hydrolase [Alphaproteobacteria bacterium]